MQLIPIQQQLKSSPLADLPAAVGQQLDSLSFDPPQGPVAITAGSRGIANIATILRACGEWLRLHGADPFVVPAMGSHNGGTANGQTAILAALGITEATLNMAIRSSMETVQVGAVPAGPVYMDRLAHEAAGVLIVNRVKLHTSFGGPPYGKHCESGVAKMLTVGLGKTDGAVVFHQASTAEKPPILSALAEQILATEKIFAGLAILEDGYDQTAELHALPPDKLLAREAELLAHYELTYFPRLPVDDLNVLVIEQIGKNFSGTGMDTNVIGRRGLSDAPDPATPSINAIAALDLSRESCGNAIGVGLADVVTQRLADATDHAKTQLNARTAGGPKKGELPLVLPDDESVIAWLRENYGESRWMRIPNTLRLDRLHVSKDLLNEGSTFRND